MDRIYIKAKIKKSRSKDKTTFQYPEKWQSDKIHVVAYEDNPEAMGNVEEFCVGVITLETWEEMKDDPDITQVTPDEANTDGKKWKPQRARIIDQEKVIMALAVPEAQRNQTQINTLDPEHDENGINQSLEFDIRRFVAPGQIEETLTAQDLTEG